MNVIEWKLYKTNFLIRKVCKDLNWRVLKHLPPHSAHNCFSLSTQLPYLTSRSMKMLKLPRMWKRRRLREVKKMGAPKLAIRMHTLELPIIHLRKRTISALNSKKLS